MSNRVISYIEQIEREAEHAKRVERVKRSDEMYVAAMEEANDHGITLTCRTPACYTVADARHTVWLYAATNTVFRQMVGEPRSEIVEGMPETDVYDLVLMFAEGRFLQ